MSNVKFGSPSPKVSVETSYRGIGKSHHGSAETCHGRALGHLFFTQLRLTSSATRNRDAHSTWLQLPTALVKLWSNTSAVRQMSNLPSFVRLNLDNISKLAGICKDWGLVSGKYFVGKWGHGEDEDRLYRFPAFGQLNIILRST